MDTAKISKLLELKKLISSGNMQMNKLVDCLKAAGSEKVATGKDLETIAVINTDLAKPISKLTNYFSKPNAITEEEFNQIKAPLNRAIIGYTNAGSILNKAEETPANAGSTDFAAEIVAKLETVKSMLAEVKVGQGKGSGRSAG